MVKKVIEANVPCRMMRLNFTVNETLESAMLIYMHAVAVLSLLIAAPTFYLLYYKTNKNSQRYKMCLINLVFWTTLMDVHFGVLFIPVPFFPLLAGYCIGPLCALGLPMHFNLAFMFFIVTGVCGGIFGCFLFRNQAVLPAYYRCKLSNKDFKIVCLMLYGFFMIPSVVMSTAYGETLTGTKGEQYLEENHPAMLWIMTRPNWVVHGSTAAISMITIVIMWLFALVVIFCAIIIGFISHTFYILADQVIFSRLEQNLRIFTGQSQHMSGRTKKFHRNLTMNLISQSVLLSMVLAVPLMVFGFSILTESFPYEVNWAFFCFLLLHSTVHSTSLILTTSSYKNTILVWLRIKKSKDIQSFMTTATVSAMH